MKKMWMLAGMLVMAVLFTACESDDELMRRMSSLATESTTEAAYGDSKAAEEKTEAETSESEKTETGAAEETATEEKTTEEKATSYPEDLVSDDADYTESITYDGTYVHDYYFPHINYESKVCDSINEEMRAFAKENKENYGADYYRCSDVTYEWSLTGDVLSLIVWGNDSDCEEDYIYLYNVNLKDDVLMTSDELLAYIGVGNDEYAGYIDDGLEECLASYGAYEDTSWDFWQDCISNTLSDGNKAATKPYIGENGHLKLLLYITIPAGSGQVREIYDTGR